MRIDNKNLDRLKSHIKFDGCWFWTGGVDPDGYGIAWYQGKSHRAHRLFYKVYKQNISNKEMLDHLCRNRNCVNPDHLEIVTARENVLRGKSYMAERAKSRYCIRGHILDKVGKPNKYHPYGQRYCSICKLARMGVT